MKKMTTYPKIAMRMPPMSGMKSEPRTCPCCGESPEIFQVDGCGDWMIRCLKHGAVSSPVLADVLDIWNSPRFTDK